MDETSACAVLWPYKGKWTAERVILKRFEFFLKNSLSLSLFVCSILKPIIRIQSIFAIAGFFFVCSLQMGIEQAKNKNWLWSFFFLVAFSNQISLKTVLQLILPLLWQILLSSWQISIKCATDLMVIYRNHSSKVITAHGFMRCQPQPHTNTDHATIPPF